MAVDLLERTYLSAYSNDPAALNIYVGGTLGNADGAVTATFVNEDSGVDVFISRVAGNQTVGAYTLTLTSVDTSQPGHYTLTWSYTVDGLDQIYPVYLYIGNPSPPYDNLESSVRALIDNVWIRLADIFDSQDGGPALQSYFQSHFGRGRIAQLARIAVGRLNTMSQPVMTYTIDPPATFPLNQWGSVLESMIYVECLRHLIRSYVEQPEFVGGSVTRLDRRDYIQRWQQVMDDEQKMLKQQIDVFKIRNMGLGTPQILAAGGVFGRYAPTRIAGWAAARPMSWARFY